MVSGKAVSILAKSSGSSSNFVPGTVNFGLNKSISLSPFSGLVSSSIPSAFTSVNTSSSISSPDRVYRSSSLSFPALASSAPTGRAVSQSPSVSSGAVVTRGDGGVSVAMPDYLYADLAFTAADVDNDLVQLGDLHDALVTKLLHQGRSDFFGILNFQSSSHFFAPPS